MKVLSKVKRIKRYQFICLTLRVARKEYSNYFKTLN